jgi:hypothetical protein
MLRPAASLDRQKRPLSQGFDPDGYPAEPPDSDRASQPLPRWELIAPSGAHRDARKGVVMT